MRNLIYAVMIIGFIFLAIHSFAHGELQDGLYELLIAMLWFLFSTEQERR